MRRTTVMWQSNGCSSRTSDSVMPPPPRIVTRAPEQVAALGRRPRRGPGVRAEAAQAGERQRQGQLGDRLGVDALAARPRAVVVEQVDEVLDAGERQLHPRRLRRRVERRAPARRGRGGRPTRCASASARATRWPPPAMTASATQAGAPSGRDGDAWGSGVGMVASRLVRDGALSDSRPPAVRPAACRRPGSRWPRA